MAYSDRLHLPLMSAAQAQKEVTHNEGLAVLDAAVQSVVVAIAPSSVPASPVPGQCWIVGTSATGAWAGEDGALAIWTSGGWRFLAPFEGMFVWSVTDGMTARYIAGAWSVGMLTAGALVIDGEQVTGARRPAIADPASGSIIDIEARATISQVLDALRTHGLIEI